MLKLALIANSNDSLIGFFDFFRKNKNKIKKFAAQEIKITYILNYSTEKETTFYSESEFNKVEIIDDYNEILVSNDVDIILDLTRNNESPAYLLQALKTKKAVITTNVKLIAENYLEIKQIEQKFQSKLFFAAAFSPLHLNTLIENLYVFDEIKELNAILNTTTNYILSEMEKRTISMKETIEQAKEFSYTEENPDLDLNGVDSLNKLILLADLIYNTVFDPSIVKAKGIKGITSYDLIYADELGYKIKLICTIKKENQKLYLGVRPNLVSKDSFLATINENSNGVELFSNYNGKTNLKAENSGLAAVNLLSLDLIKAASFIENEKQLIFEDELKDKKVYDLYQEHQSSFYIRLQLKKNEKTIEEIKNIFSEKNLADLILHDNVTETPLLPVIIMTKKIKEKDLEKLLEEVEALEGVLTVNNIIAVKAG